MCLQYIIAKKRIIHCMDNASLGVCFCVLLCSLYDFSLPVKTPDCVQRIFISAPRSCNADSKFLVLLPSEAEG
jgi:hypothetical protein